jgi:hypothetical protein
MPSRISARPIEPIAAQAARLARQRRVAARRPVTPRQDKAGIDRVVYHDTILEPKPDSKAYVANHQ